MKSYTWDIDGLDIDDPRPWRPRFKEYTGPGHFTSKRQLVDAIIESNNCPRDIMCAFILANQMRREERKP